MLKGREVIKLESFGFWCRLCWIAYGIAIIKKYKVSLVENNEEKLNSLKDYKFYLLLDKDFKKYSKAVNELDIISSIKNLNIEALIFSIICVPTNFGF